MILKNKIKSISIHQAELKMLKVCIASMRAYGSARNMPEDLLRDVVASNLNQSMRELAYGNRDAGYIIDGID